MSTVGAVWYLGNQISSALAGGFQIPNLGSTVKYVAIGLAAKFTISSLTLLYYLWRVFSLQREIAKIRTKINRLEG